MTAYDDDPERGTDGSELIFKTWVIAIFYGVAICGILAAVVAGELAR